MLSNDFSINCFFCCILKSVLCKIPSFCVATESLPRLKLACPPQQFKSSYGTAIFGKKGIRDVRRSTKRTNIGLDEGGKCAKQSVREFGWHRPATGPSPTTRCCRCWLPTVRRNFPTTDTAAADLVPAHWHNTHTVSQWVGCNDPSDTQLVTWSQRLCSRLTALWRYINFVLLLLLLWFSHVT